VCVCCSAITSSLSFFSSSLFLSFLKCHPLTHYTYNNKMRNSLIARHLFHLLKGPGLIYISYSSPALFYISLISLNECIINSFLFVRRSFLSLLSLVFDPLFIRLLIKL
jgi:hypothetical protein